MDTRSQPSARTRQWRRVGGYFLPGLLVALAGVGSQVAQQRFGAPPWTLPAAVTLVLILCAKPIVHWWQAFDEVAKEAHRESWFWGGSVGLMVSVVIMMGVQSYSGVLRSVDRDPVSMYIAGAASVFLPIVTGYLVWWCAWWLKRR